MKAISIRAPWWWLILHGGKDIENRDWPTSFRGPVLIHASKWFDSYEVRKDFYYARDRIIGQALELPPVSLADLRAKGGMVVGTATIVDCVSTSPSRWFFGKHGFVLANATPLDTPWPCKGRLGLFEAELPSQVPA